MGVTKMSCLVTPNSFTGEVTIQVGRSPTLLGGSGPKTASRKRRGLAYYPRETADLVAAAYEFPFRHNLPVGLDIFQELAA
jgi:hypothetical protein